jgi:hypothetical protein
MVSSSRITWFLGLRTTLRLPRHPLAPLPRVLAFHKHSLGHVEPDSFAESVARKASDEHQRSRLLRSSPAAGIFVAKPTVAAADFLPGIRSVPPPPHPPAGRVPSRSADWTKAVARTQAMPLQSKQAATKILTRVQLPTIRIPRLPPPPNATGRAPTPQMQFAPVGARSDKQSPASPAVGLSTRRTIQRGQPLLSQPTISTASRHSSTNQNYVNTTESEAPEPIATERDTPVGHPPPASTLHIDGAALGRWAVQHLARTLGKPTAGMTGVDPRMNLPRSRVQPF